MFSQNKQNSEILKYVGGLFLPYLFEMLISEKPYSAQLVKRIINEVKAMSQQTKKARKKTGTSGNKQRVTHWLNPDVDIEEAMTFIEALHSEEALFQDNVLTLLSTSHGFTLKQNDDGTYTGFVFVAVENEEDEYTVAIRSSAATPDLAFYGMLYKHNVLYDAGKTLPRFDENSQMRMFT